MPDLFSRDPATIQPAPVPSRVRHKIEKEPDGFADFWSAYPRKVAKGAARKAYAVALQKGVGAADILAGAMRYAAERTEQDEKYTKHPATWLNGECWLDDTAAAPQESTLRTRNGHRLSAVDEKLMRSREHLRKMGLDV